jgi:ribosomal protein L37E
MIETEQEIETEITCKRCGEVEEIVSLGLCDSCLVDYDDERMDREDYWREEV